MAARIACLALLLGTLICQQAQAAPALKPLMGADNSPLRTAVAGA